MAEIAGTRRKADEVRESLLEHAGRVKEIGEGKYILQQVEAVKTQNKAQIEGAIENH